jgi:hypothetical protein
MPFKGDRRLGGPHRNEATLNGTSSDFDSVLAAGTVISGPTDTSRNALDAVGNLFYMPYSTTVYADGLGGQNSIETWGLIMLDLFPLMEGLLPTQGTQSAIGTL